MRFEQRVQTTVITLEVYRDPGNAARILEIETDRVFPLHQQTIENQPSSNSFHRYNVIVTQITLQLDEEIALELSKASREQGVEPETTARQMIERALRVRRFDRARSHVLKALGDEAPKTDNEAFERLS
ncbi:MAG TPA: hypothetical protein PK402_03920 [Tepidisphaeraceae bacterium]|nr:hypothetical protein [Tepidisphaeraceae bacterium]